jgi:hypothetical protein
VNKAAAAVGVYFRSAVPLCSAVSPRATSPKVHLCCRFADGLKGTVHSDSMVATEQVELYCKERDDAEARACDDYVELSVVDCHRMWQWDAGSSPNRVSVRQGVAGWDATGGRDRDVLH